MKTVSPRLATPKQIEYIHFLLDRLEDYGENLTDILIDLNANYGEDEDFNDWLRRQTIEEASKIIEYLKLL